MKVSRRQSLLYVNRSLQKWVLLDEEGNYWILPGGECPWEHRQPFDPHDDLELERVPGHYKSLLGIPTQPESTTP